MTRPGAKTAMLTRNSKSPNSQAPRQATGPIPRRNHQGPGSPRSSGSLPTPANSVANTPLISDKSEASIWPDRLSGREQKTFTQHEFFSVWTHNGPVANSLPKPSYAVSSNRTGIPYSMLTVILRFAYDTCSSRSWIMFARPTSKSSTGPIRFEFFPPYGIACNT